MAQGLKLVIGADVSEAQRALKTVVTDANVAGKEIDKSFSKSTNPLTSSLNAASVSIKNITQNIEDETISLEEQREILAALKKDFAALSFNEVNSPIGKEFQKDIKIAESEIKRLSLGATNSFGIVRSQIDKLADKIKKGSSQFTVLGRSGQLAGSNLGALSGVLKTTATDIPVVAAQTNRLKEGFLNVASGAGKAFSVLRQVAFILPGIGIAGLLGGLVDLVAGLFNTADAAEKATTAFDGFEARLDSVKDGIQNLKSEVDFLNTLGSINVKIFNLGDLEDLRQQSFAQQDLVQKITAARDRLIDESIRLNQTTEQINQKAVEEAQKTAREQLGTEIQSVENFKITEDQRVKLLEDTNKSISDLDAQILEETNKSRLIYRRIQLQKNEDQDKANKAAKDAQEKFINDTISKAKDLAKFFSDTTPFELFFDVSPLDTKQQTFEKAKKFIQGALSGRTFPGLKLNEEVVVDADALARTRKQIEADEKNRIKLFADISPDSQQNKEAAAKATEGLRREIDRLTKNNPILIEVQFRVDRAKQKQSVIDSFLGLQTSVLDAKDAKGNDLFTQQEKNALQFAKTIDNVLAPAFTNLFNAIKAGENPMKAFFEGLGQSVLQLIQQLIQAAITAAILSAIVPGAGGFGQIFGKLIGFRAAGGPVSGNHPFIVGERGPELFVPKTNGDIVPNDQLWQNGMGSGRQVVVLNTMVRGNNLALVQARTSRRNQRLGATG